MNMMKSNPQELDEKRLSAMKVKILEAEMKNLKTKTHFGKKHQQTIFVGFH